MTNPLSRLISAIIDSWRDMEAESRRRSLSRVREEEQLKAERDRQVETEVREVAAKTKLVEAQANQAEAKAGKDSAEVEPKRHRGMKGMVSLRVLRIITKTILCVTGAVWLIGFVGEIVRRIHR